MAEKDPSLLLEDIKETGNKQHDRDNSTAYLDNTPRPNEILLSTAEKYALSSDASNDSANTINATTDQTTTDQDPSTNLTTCDVSQRGVSTVPSRQTKETSGEMNIQTESKIIATLCNAEQGEDVDNENSKSKQNHKESDGSSKKSIKGLKEKTNSKNNEELLKSDRWNKVLQNIVSPCCKSRNVFSIARKQSLGFSKGAEDEKSPSSKEKFASKSPSTYTDPCDFCKKPAKHYCQVCSYLYCPLCLSELHPKRGPYKSHNVIETATIAIEKQQRCPEHGLLVQLFCAYCQTKRCPECANTKCFLHFKGKLRRNDIESEKEKLMKDLETATTKLQFIEKYKVMVQDELQNIQINALLSRERIRQEFASFHDLLTQKEELMLQILEKETQFRSKHVKETLECDLSKLEEEEAFMTSTVTDLVQCKNPKRFVEECVVAKDMCQRVDELIKDFDRKWAINSAFQHSFLHDEPFSMFLEKESLSEKLDSISEERSIRFKQGILTVDRNTGPVSLSEHLNIPIFPPSTEVTFSVELTTGNTKAYQCQTSSLKDVLLNEEETVSFVAGRRYILKVTPNFTVVCSKALKSSRKGKSAHMLIVVDTLFQPTQSDVKRLLCHRLKASVTTFEKANLLSKRWKACCIAEEERRHKGHKETVLRHKKIERQDINGSYGDDDVDDDYDYERVSGDDSGENVLCKVEYDEQEDNDGADGKENFLQVKFRRIVKSKWHL